MENKGENKTLVKIGNFIDRAGIIQNILNIYKNTRKNIKTIQLSGLKQSMEVERGSTLGKI